MSKNSIGLDVALTHSLQTTPAEMANHLRSFHPSLASVQINENESFSSPEGLLMVIQWDNHVVRLFGVDAPLPDTVIQSCVLPAFYDTSIKEQIFNHQAHLLLFHLNENVPVLEQYTALTIIAAALYSKGAIAILNESSNSSLPMQFLIAPNTEQDQLEYLRTLPLPLLYCGMATFQLEDTQIIWMRTYGAQKFGLSNLALQLTDQTQDINGLELFSDSLSYSLNTNKKPKPGDSSEHAGRLFIFRQPTANEYFLIDEENTTLVFELV
jgi:hypothetical protein